MKKTVIVMTNLFTINRPDTSSLAVRHVHIYDVWFNLSVLTKEIHIRITIQITQLIIVRIVRTINVLLCVIEIIIIITGKVRHF